MFNMMFDFIFMTLMIILLFIHFFEYRNNLCSSRWMSPTKLNLLLTTTSLWFLNNLFYIFRCETNYLENTIGAMGCLFFAAILIFVCYPKMSRASQLFFLKRYTFITLFGLLSFFLPSDVFLLVALVGCVMVQWEIYHLKKCE